MERSILLFFTDQGAFLAHGVPAFDLGVTSPGGWLYYHTSEDTMIREMDRSGDTSQSPEPLLYFEASRTFMSSLPLKAVGLALVVPLCWWTFLACNGRWMGLRHLLG
jgi:hypothetical protein